MRSQDLQQLGPAEVLGRINRFIHASVDTGKFITAFLGLLDPATGTFRYANAGHDAPLVLCPDGSVRELTGGGLIRSSGGWHAPKELRRMGVHFKSDERLLGESDFIDTVLKAADEKLDRKYRIQGEGWDFEAVVSRVCDLFKLTGYEVLSVSKQRKRAVARSVLAYWAVKELGMSASAVAERLALSPSAASRCVQRGERIVAEDELAFWNP